MIRTIGCSGAKFRPAANSGADGCVPNQNAMSRFRFVFVVSYLTSILILAVYLRDANNRIFYQLSREKGEQRRLQKELADKQLWLERLINPAAVSERIDQ